MLSLISLAVLSVVSAPVLAQTCTPCEDVHFFLARGNNEPYPGRQGALVSATCDGVASCGYEDLIYSALFSDLSCQTTYDGCIAGHTQLTAYADRCPDSKLILAGYSQGAQIVSDILGGGGGLSFNDCLQPTTAPLDPNTSPGNRLSAVIIFGNTRHTANQPYNFGNGSALDGLYPKPANMLPGIAAYAPIMRDWCIDVDPICAADQEVFFVQSHLGYYDVYAQAAAEWIHEVAGIEKNSDFVTVIPTMVSGTAEDYATVPPGTPSGTVTTAATTTAIVECGSTTSTSRSSTITISANPSSTEGARVVEPTSSLQVAETTSALPSATNSDGAEATTAESNEDAGAKIGLSFGALCVALFAMVF
jgi:hypothetical protein